jgi:hypothetical protein
VNHGSGASGEVTVRGEPMNPRLPELLGRFAAQWTLLAVINTAEQGERRGWRWRRLAVARTGHFSPDPFRDLICFILADLDELV